MVRTLPLRYAFPLPTGCRRARRSGFSKGLSGLNEAVTARRTACGRNVRSAFAALAILLLAATSPADAEAEKPYASAAILFPANGEVVRANGGQLTVTARIAPTLRPDHRVQLMLDGGPNGQPHTSPQFHLQDVDRGTHQVRLQILDSAGGIVFIGQSSEFHLLRHSILQRRPRQSMP